jgi:hypothetical protein
MAFLRQRELGSCSDMPLASRPLMLDMQVIVRLLVLEVQRLDYLHIKHNAARQGKGNLRLPASGVFI